LRNLIVTADDFGAAVEVNQAVERAHRDGILSAASLMVSGAAANDAVQRARTMPHLRVGLHLVLVEGKPVLPANTVPDLVDSSGHFRTDMARAGAAMFFRPKVRAQLAAEIEAQFAAFAATGLRLDHVNAHKHFHLHPTIAALVVKTAAAHGVKGARVPLEPQAVLGRIEKHRRSGMVALTAGPAGALSPRRDHSAGLRLRPGLVRGDDAEALGRPDRAPAGRPQRDLYAPRYRALSGLGARLSVWRGTGGADQSGAAGQAGGQRDQNRRLF
jgi:hopanoid biosynthesis associated protein HpnK